MTSSFPLRLHPGGLHRPPIKSTFLSPFRARRSLNSSFVAFSVSNPSSGWDREEARWQREEQRWLREEQRWIREEARWLAEREALLGEVSALRRRLDAIERGSGAPPLDVGGVPPPPPAMLAEKAEVKEMVLEEFRVSYGDVAGEKKRRALRLGAEGEDVKEMQEALQKLGFYSGEEDMDFSSFMSGTERAVKTWQSSLGTAEDGVMTEELLRRLFSGDAGLELNSDQKGDHSSAGRDFANGTPVSSVTEIAEVQQTIIKKSGNAEVEVSEHRVFLLGENRWEEPSRLVGNNKPIGTRKTSSATKCLSCQGEGQLMCTECDGTGEPNIEPQFLEWVGEDTKCPYCEGLGYTVCDVCNGKTTVPT